LLPMTDFRWMTDDRLVQRTILGDRLELIANFRDDAFHTEGTLMPKRSLLARRRTGTDRVYTPTAR
jgi:hypothetical protein